MFGEYEVYDHVVVDCVFGWWEYFIVVVWWVAGIVYGFKFIVYCLLCCVGRHVHVLNIGGELFRVALWTYGCVVDRSV